MNRITTRLVGLAASIGIAGFAVGTPFVLVAVGAVPSASTFAWSSLNRPDDGTFALSVIGIVAWAAWLTLTGLLGLEVVARARGVAAVRVSGLTIPQRLAARTVAAASLLFLAVPVAGPAVAMQQPSITADLLRDENPAQPSSPPTAHAEEANSAPESNTQASRTATQPYVVRRGDSLWKIAEQALGDGRRYVDLVALNADVLHGRPDFIEPGLVLNVPDDGRGQPERYVVQPGDTLSKIAEAKLGAAERFPEIVEASRDTIQPDGHHLEDPDLIVPGWNLTMPTPDATPSHTPPPSISEDPASAEAEHDLTPPWALPGLIGAGAMLAGNLLLALRRAQRTQRRFRTPGHRIDPPPAELLNAEKTVHVSGTQTAPSLERLDAVLRTLAAPNLATPDLAWAALNDEEVSLKLHGPAVLPPPWAGEGRSWTAPLDADIEPMPDVLPPYPLLVAVGQDHEGRLCFVNLEPLACQTVAGPPEQVDAFARYVAAELTLSPWSLLTEVTAIGIAEELTAIDPLRFQYQPASDTESFRRLAGRFDPTARLPGFDPDRYRAFIVAERADQTALRKLVDTVTADPGRTGTAVLSLNQPVREGEPGFVLDDAGVLRIPALGLSLRAAGLTAPEATACASIIEVARDANVTPMPGGESGNDQFESLLDAAGAIRPEFTEPRNAGPAGAESLLPEESALYVARAATTEDDIATLAALPHTEVREKLEAADPRLDEDLRDWFSEAPALPHLKLLGPVSARTRGSASAVARRKPYYIEVLAFLALHPRGSTADEVGAALSISASRTRTDLGVIRSWLGENPRTGQLHLPDARASRAAALHGVPTYQVEDVLCDLDLFRRLRARAQARGENGIDDLQAALRLVSGEPFTHLRPAGWTWLLEGERLDHVMACAVIDVAHIVTTHALACGDLGLAQFAAEVGYAAGPDDDISRLDLVQVAAAGGNTELAERLLQDDILNRTDDAYGPTDLPPRTRQIVRQRNWDRAGRGSG